MNNSGRVGEIFHAAGTAFTTLGDLTTDLKGSSKPAGPGGGGGGSKWTEAEIDALHKAVHNFANELKAISDTIKNRTVSQIQGALQRKAYADAGIKAIPQQPPPKPQQSVIKQSASATSEAAEVDVE